MELLRSRPYPMQSVPAEEQHKEGLWLMSLLQDASAVSDAWRSPSNP